MAAQLNETHIDMLAQLRRNASMRWSEFEDRSAVSELIKRGLVKQTGGARLTLSRSGLEQLEALEVQGKANGAPSPKVNGNGNGRRASANSTLSEAALETLAAIAGGGVVKGRGIPVILDKLRALEYIRMGATQWEATALGRERLIAEKLIPSSMAERRRATETALKDNRETVEIPAVPEDERGTGDARVSVGNALLDDGQSFEDMSAGEIAALDERTAESQEGDEEAAPAPDERETTVLVNGVELTLPFALDLSDEDTRERVLQAIGQALSPVEEGITLTLRYGEPDREISLVGEIEEFSPALAAIASFGHDCTDCASPCLHRRVLDELMAISPTARELYDHEAAKDALRARMTGV